MSLLTDLKRRKYDLWGHFKELPEDFLARKSYSGLDWGLQMCFLQKNSETFAECNIVECVIIAIK